jgi:hypothetical protein
MVRKIQPSREEIRKKENDPKRIAELEAERKRLKKNSIPDTRTRQEKRDDREKRELFLTDPSAYKIEYDKNGKSKLIPEKKPKKEYISTGDVSSALELVESMVKQPKKQPKMKTSNVSRAVNLIEDIIHHKDPPNTKRHDTSDEVLKTIFNIMDTKLPKGKKPNTKEGSEIIEKIDKIIKPTKTEKRLLLDAYEFKGNKPLIEQLADSIKTYPEFDSINKTKIKKYSFDVVDKFNKKYPELMLRIFKDQKTIDKLLTKKANKVQKNILSEEKAVVRKKKYSEQAKEARKETKIKKYKHLDDMTDAELKKFKQAKNYYMRKSLTSDILPKGLNKSDPEGLNNVCKELAETGFDTMSEHLFMKIYEG